MHVYLVCVIHTNACVFGICVIHTNACVFWYVLYTPMHVYLVCVIHTNYLLTTGWAKYFIFFFTKQYMNVALKKVSYFHRMCQ